jgi:hypothetical protein
MESGTFRKWLAEHGCHFDTDQEKRGTGHANVTVHREGRKAEVPLGGPHQILDPHIVRRASEELGLDWSELPEPKSRVTREKIHNRRGSYIRRARKLVCKQMQREGLLPMKPRVAQEDVALRAVPASDAPTRRRRECRGRASSIVEEGS